MIREAQRLHGLNQVPEAIAAYQRLLLRWPAHANSWFNLGVLLRRSSRFDQALTCYRKAIELGVVNPEEVHLNRAVIYADHLRQDAAAERELQAALAINPNYVPALLNLANINEDRGRRAAAMGLYQRVLELDPQCFLALARYANIQKPADCGPQLVARLQAALAHPAADDAARADLGFALGRALDASGYYDEAFFAYAAANEICRRQSTAQGVRYQRREHEQFIDRLIQVGAVAPGPGVLVAHSRPQPIFICGMFRSGSTLAEQLLAKHPGVAPGGELGLLPSWVANKLAPFPESLATMPAGELDRLATRYLDAVSTLFPDATHAIDKRPDNFLNIGLIKSLFPDAKIVHTTREPIDNCLAIFFLQMSARMNHSTDLLDIGHYYREYRRLMAHWERQFGSDIIGLNYDRFVHDPERTARPVFEALGLRWDSRYLEHVPSERSIKTASVWQVREPLYTGSTGRARHYTRLLAPLAKYLADLTPT